MFVQADVDRLDAQVKAGVRRIRFSDGREFENISVGAEYFEFRNMMLGEIAKQSGTPPIRQVRVFTTQGFE